MSFILQVSINEAWMAPYRPPSSVSGEQMILAPEREGPHGALDEVVVDFDPPLLEVAGQARPARERVADRLGEFRFAGTAASLASNQGFIASRIGPARAWRAARRAGAPIPRISRSMA
jgi:hypothetical protein